MSNDTQRRWTKTDGEDAARLLAEMMQREEKASGGFERPEKIQNSTGVVPAVPVEKAGSRSARGGDALHGFPQPEGQAGEKVAEERGGGTQLTRPTATRMGGDERSGLVFHNDNCAGEVIEGLPLLFPRAVSMRSPAPNADSNTDTFTRTGDFSFRKPGYARWGDW